MEYDSDIIQELGYKDVFELLRSKEFLNYLNNKHKIRLDNVFNESFLLKNIGNINIIQGESTLHIDFTEYLNHLIRNRKLLKITNNIKNKC